MPRAGPRLEQRLGHRRAADDRALEAREVGVREPARAAPGRGRSAGTPIIVVTRFSSISASARPASNCALEDDASRPSTTRAAPARSSRRRGTAAGSAARRRRRECRSSRSKLEVRPEAVRVREQRALRLPGRAGRVDQEQAVAGLHLGTSGASPGAGALERLPTRGRSRRRAPRTRPRRGRATARRRRAGSASSGAASRQ